tara:strand:+ start:4554 stop:4907 length:354 start_codon:yes stop_codon:yes gene_type:complete
MSSQMIIRFQKADQYNNNIFIAMVDDVDGYETLTGFTNSLAKLGLTTFLPIYRTEKFATIRFKPNGKFKFVSGNTYALTFEVRKKFHKEKDYVSCYILNSKLDTIAPPMDYGELISL